MINRALYPWTEISRQYKDGSFDPWTFAPVSSLPKIRAYSELKGVSTLRSVWIWSKPSLQTSKIGDFHIDLDSGLDVDKARRMLVELIDGLERHYEIDPYTLKIGFSGKKGFNLIIPVETFLTEPIDKPEEVYRRFGEFLRLSYDCIDLGIYSRRRLWKLENSRHPATGLYRIMLKPEEIRELTTEEIKEKAALPRMLNHKRPKYSERLSRTFEMIRAALEREEKNRAGEVWKTPADKSFSSLQPEEKIPRKYRQTVSEGNRNPVICRLVGTLERAGCGYNEAAEIVKAFNLRYCSPSKPEEEALIPVRHYYGVKT